MKTYVKLSFFLICSSIAVLSLQGCTNVRNSLGLEKESPDEFTVTTRAPLEMPSALALPPPNPGAPRPQEQAPVSQAKQAVFGDVKQQNISETSSGTLEETLLQQAGTEDIEPGIRATINKETQELHDRNKPVAEKLLNIGGDEGEPSATVVDAVKERERIEQNLKEGKSITEGETPTIEE